MNENTPRDLSGQTDAAAAPDTATAVDPEAAADQVTPEKPAAPDFASTADKPEKTAEPPAPPGGRGLSVLALLLAVAAVAGSGLVIWNQRQAASMVDNGQAQLNATLGQLESNTRKLAARFEALETEARSASAEQAAVEDLLLRLSARTDGLESNVAGLARSREASGTQLRRAEAEQLLRIANYQLNLARNPDTALAALLEADALLARLADPGLQPVRRQLTDDVLALRSAERVDLEGIAMRLDSLARQVNQLPLNSDARELSGLETSAQPASGGWARFKQKVSEFVAGIFAVRRTESSSGPLLSREEAFFLRRNLELELQAARLAVLSTNAEVFAASISAARRWTEAYFDREASSVAGFVRDLNALAQQRLVVALPDISGSLRVFRELADRRTTRPGANLITPPLAPAERRPAEQGPPEQRPVEVEDRLVEEVTGEAAAEVANGAVDDIVDEETPQAGEQ
ncbi:MAG: uroporphyrinogen-III C-methyltransferase [Gammaproteobacteria bacterium]